MWQSRREELIRKCYEIIGAFNGKIIDSSMNGEYLCRTL
jgi:hypothetical protein